MLPDKPENVLLTSDSFRNRFPGLEIPEGFLDVSYISISMPLLQVFDEVIRRLDDLDRRVSRLETLE